MRDNQHCNCYDDVCCILEVIDVMFVKSKNQWPAVKASKVFSSGLVVDDMAEKITIFFGLHHYYDYVCILCF